MYKYGCAPRWGHVRQNTARRSAQTYVASLLLNVNEHAEAFEDEDLTAAERAIAHAEIERLGMELMAKYKCDL